MNEFQTARQVSAKLSGAGFEAYIIGGAVRDLMLGRQPKDFDLATNATPEQIYSITGLDKATYKDTAQAYGVTRLKSGRHLLEIATFRKDIEAHKGRKQTKVRFATLHEDLERRDFTINALAYDPATFQVIDYVGGLEDVDNKIIRFIGTPSQRIREDPLRILRAIRLRNELGFAYAPETIKAIRSAVSIGLHQDIAVDRQRQELTLMITAKSRRQALEDLDYFGLLESILPEVTAGKLIEQPREFHAEGDVWTHQLLVMEALPAQPSRQLVWAALLHDIGKAKTQTLPKDTTDRIRFNRHYEVSADMARSILLRLRFSKADIEGISWIIYHHINIDDLPKMRPSHQQTMMNNPSFADLLKLHKADAAASWKDSGLGRRARFKSIEQIWRAHLAKTPEQKQPSLKKDLGIDGNWLAQNFPQLKPGPEFTQIMSMLQDDYINNGARSQSYYINLVKETVTALGQPS